MRKYAALAAAILVIAAALPAEAGLGLKIKGGYTWISYGDYNEWVDETNARLPYEFVEGVKIPRYENINWMPEITAELTYPIAPTFTGSVGIGYLSGKSEYSFSYEPADIALEEDHTVKAIPVTVNVYWEPSLGSLKPFVYGGIGLYRTSLEFTSSFTFGDETDGYTAEMDKWGFGLQGGAGLSFSFSPKVSFDFGIQGRWADISGFEGTATRLDGETKEVYLGKGWVEEDGEDIYYYGPTDKADNMDEGTVSLSGYTLFIGMTIGF
jgi:opacity protein-like surface antigen